MAIMKEFHNFVVKWCDKFRDNPFVFQGTLKKINIVSNNICYGPQPRANDEVEQHITIDNKGHVWFSGYNYGNGSDKYVKNRSKNFKIKKEVVERLFDVVTTRFGNDYIETFSTDAGEWKMELTNTDGTIYKFRGSLCDDSFTERNDLSELVRDSVGMQDLFVFDGNLKPDVINRITLDYHRVTKIKSENTPGKLPLDVVTWDYTECLIIDRKAEMLKHIQNIGTGCKITHQYEVEEGIESLLDNFEEGLFEDVEEYPKDIIETPNQKIDYKITIDYERKLQRVISGKYDKYGLPIDFDNFIETVLKFVQFYGLGEIFDSSIYNRTKRRKNEYIYCSVVFEEGYKEYYYLTENDEIKIGDFVVVPAGKDNHETIVEVVNVEYYDEENIPLPLGETKSIIRKCTRSDFDLLD